MKWISRGITSCVLSFGLILAAGSDIVLASPSQKQSYSDTNPDHRSAALNALSHMAEAMGRQRLRYGYSGKVWLLGFPPADPSAATRMFWPRDLAGARRRVLKSGL